LRNLQILRDGGACALHFGDALHRCGQYAARLPKALKQGFRQRLGVLARNGAEEQELQQLVIRQRAGARFIEAFAQARAVIVIVWAYRLVDRWRVVIFTAMSGVASQLERKELAESSTRAGALGGPDLPDRPAIAASARVAFSACGCRGPQAIW
jgi:hypothetical protein